MKHTHELEALATGDYPALVRRIAFAMLEAVVIAEKAQLAKGCDAEQVQSAIVTGTFNAIAGYVAVRLFEDAGLTPQLQAGLQKALVTLVQATLSEAGEASAE